MYAVGLWRLGLVPAVLRGALSRGHQSVKKKSRKIQLSKRKNAATKEELEDAERKDAERTAEELTCMSYSFTSYGKDEINDLYRVFEADLLAEFLLTESVSGGCKHFRLHDLIMIDDARIVCCWVSPIGKTDAERHMFGIRMVSYFHPMRAVVLNLTVIFKNDRGQRNLDPMNKVRILFIVSSFTYQSTFFLYICFLDEGNNVFHL